MLASSPTASELLTLRASQTSASFISSSTHDPRPHRVVIGGAILHPSSTPPSVLIVQRAATERSYPNEWEIPGGHVDPGETILQAVAREIFEETALKVTRITAEFEGFHYLSTKYESDEADRDDGKLAVCTCQLNFCVEVESTEEIRLNPEEHQRFDWCSLENIEQFRMTPAMKKVVTDALHAIESIDKTII
ncbi:hypothetical protein LPJ53_005569 [Coemansia erecta]|uniref:Nudix hydrolase domain-containing protein n=1 Tax=Coemansia erecta TaxID=147472 RepID=A0A9W8CPP1_9FUNG|nr:hypothetical protein LPJ53_005569 [Coemansia erecta]